MLEMSVPGVNIVLVPLTGDMLEGSIHVYIRSPVLRLTGS